MKGNGKEGLRERKPDRKRRREEEEKKEKEKEEKEEDEKSQRRCVTKNAWKKKSRGKGKD